MKIVIGNMFNDMDKIHHLFITTNAIVKNNGALVMGAGIAKAVRDTWAGSDVAFGSRVKEASDIKGTYGAIAINGKFGAFQVKRHFKDVADPVLIANSVQMLKGYALRYPDRVFGLNYPGIGNGKLSEEVVQPLIDELPDNVYVYKFK